MRWAIQIEFGAVQRRVPGHDSPILCSMNRIEAAVQLRPTEHNERGRQSIDPEFLLLCPALPHHSAIVFEGVRRRQRRFVSRQRREKSAVWREGVRALNPLMLLVLHGALAVTLALCLPVRVPMPVRLLYLRRVRRGGRG